MSTQTSSLSQLDVRPATTNNTFGGNKMSFRAMLPALLINALLPLLINLLARPYMSTVNALLLASAVPALYTLGSLLWKRHIDLMGVLVVVGLLLTAFFALVFKSPRLLLLQSSAVSGLFGLALLISLFFSRPILFYIVRYFMTQNDPTRSASFNADWSIPQVRTFYRTLTIVWGSVNVAHLLLLALMVFTLPISLMLVVGPLMGFAVIIPVTHWSIHYSRKNKQALAQLRQQRDAAKIA